MNDMNIANTVNGENGENRLLSEWSSHLIIPMISNNLRSMDHSGI